MIPSGVDGLDEILNGGLPGQYLYLVQGGPGVGKTTLALQFLLAGLEKGEPCLYVSLSQTARELRSIAASHGWSLDGLDIVELASAKLQDQQHDQTIFHASEVRLDKTREKIDQALNRIEPKRVVYDSLLEIRYLSGDNERFRREVLGLKGLLEEREAAVMMIDVTDDKDGDTDLESLAHGIFFMDKFLPAYGPARRRIEVRKMRGQNHASGYHDMNILQNRGVVAYPRVSPSAEREDETGSDLIRSGVDALDEMLGGGMEAGTTTLVIGQPGTGKSTMSSLYAEASLKRGEAVSLFLFEERKETFFRRSEGLGIGLRRYRDEGKLALFDFNPAEISPGEFAYQVANSVEKNGARVVVIDSLTGYINSLPRGDEAVLQMHSLLKYLSRKGVLTILVVAQHGLLGQDHDTEIDVSFLGDTVLYLRMKEEPGTIRRSVVVVKKRHGPHDLGIHELQITADGVSIGTNHISAG